MRVCDRARLHRLRKKFKTEEGGGFNPRIKPAKYRWALAPEWLSFGNISQKFDYFSNLLVVESFQ
jgi:hypothetical protein